MGPLLRAASSFFGVVALICGLAGLWAHQIEPDAFERGSRAWATSAANWLQQQGMAEPAGLPVRAWVEQAPQLALWLRDPILFGVLIAVALVLLMPSRFKGQLAKQKGKGEKAKGAGGARAPTAERGAAGSRSKSEAAPPMEPAAPENRPSGKDAKRLQKQAAQVQAEQGAEAAGDLLLDAGLRQEAFDLFIAEGLHARAGDVRNDQNRFDEAAELYEKGGKHERAAAIYARLERYDDAGRCYQAASKNSIAAEMFERAGKFRQAADCYKAIGFGRQAAQAYLKAGSEPAAAECLVQVFNDEHRAASGSEAKLQELRSICKKAGELLFKLERYEQAEEILERGGIQAAAAKIAFHRGAFEKAADLFGRVNRGDLQAKALEKLGDEIGAARALAGHLRDQGQPAEAAEQFMRAKEYGDAAPLFRTLERYLEAGEAYMEGHDYRAAAEMFSAADRPDRAGEALEKAQRYADAAERFAEAGDSARQAELLEKAGQVFAAGIAHAESDRPDEAIRLLQKVEVGDACYTRACAVLGQLFHKKGMLPLAITKLEQAVEGQPVNRANVESYYELACLRQERGDMPQAVELFEKILAFDYRHSDVSARLETSRAAARLAEPTTSSRVAVATKGGAPAEQRYEVTREIGRGGMGVVYLARDLLLERDVAYKVLPEQLRESPDALRGFLREAKAAAQLNHPNIVTVYDVGESEQGFYMAMEYVEGTTLKEIVQRRGPVAPGGVMYILRQMGEALGYAHGKKVVHRDIKTSNTMWTADKQVKIMDFGLAKLMEEVRNATTTISGTPFYMSPEQTLGRNVDHRTDLYSLGVTLYELATGQLPFRKGNVPYHHVHTAPEDPRVLNPQLPEPLAVVILRCLQKSPDDRYNSAREMVEDLASRLNDSEPEM